MAIYHNTTLIPEDTGDVEHNSSDIDNVNYYSEIIWRRYVKPSKVPTTIVNFESSQNIWKDSQITLLEYKNTKYDFFTINQDAESKRAGEIYMDPDADNSGTGASFKVKITFPTFGNDTMKINYGVLGWAELHIGSETKYIYPGNDSGGTVYYTISNVDSIEMICQSSNPNKGRAYVQFLLIDLY